MLEYHRRRLKRQREEKDKSRKTVHTVFYIFHAIAVLLGIGLCVVAQVARKGEESTMGRIDLSITYAPSLIFSIAGGLIFLAVISGLIAQFCKTSFLWLLYCAILSIFCLAVFVAAGSALSATNTHAVVLQKLKDLMADFGKTNKARQVEMTRAWDVIHRKYKCCGVNNYTEWQRVEFGLTSLRVPPSCCLPSRWAKGQRVPKNCGQNMLPDHENAKDYIYVKGCLDEIMRRLDLQLNIVGIYGLTVAFFVLLAVIISCFLILTKRV